MYDIMLNIQKIVNGETAMLSVAQIVLTLVNMTDAKNNLPPDEFENVYSLFCEYMSDTEMNELKEMNGDLYLENCETIIKEFDILAPFENYSGREPDDIEFAMFLAEIREETEKERCMDEKYVLVKKALEDNKDEYKKIVEEVFSKVERNERIEKCLKKCSDFLLEYILENLDNKHKNKLISIMNNPQKIYTIIINPDNKNIGFQAGQFLSFLYYIDGIEIDWKKCIVLNRKQKEIVTAEMAYLEKKELEKINDMLKPPSNTGCGVVIIFTILSIVALSVSTII